PPLHEAWELPVPVEQPAGDERYTGHEQQNDPPQRSAQRLDHRGGQTPLPRTHAERDGRGAFNVAFHSLLFPRRSATHRDFHTRPAVDVALSSERFSRPSTGKFRRVRISPSGQRTTSFSILVASPRPKVRRR